MHDGNAPTPQPVDDPSVSKALRDATRDLSNIDSFAAHASLEELSSRTVFTGIDVYEDSIFLAGDVYSAPATIYVELNYGGGKERTPIGGAFPGRITFRMDGDVAVLSDITADVYGQQMG